ncbi:MAG: LPP20 family lipoprotein [Candidatus Cloacimonetes bacterium]|nr:LPP20 family lipoprotein [Candidatus Cloacimonadota bacterium]
MKKIILISIFMILAVSAFAKAPKWYTTGELPDYPVKSYFIGVGEGVSYEEAQSKASAQIASQINVTIESQVESFTQELEVDDRVSYIDLFKSSINLTVNEIVQGIGIVNHEKVGNKFYVFAVLDKGQYVAGIRAELDKMWGGISKLVQDGRSLIKEGKIFAGLENYIDAQELVTPFYTKKAFHDAISPNPYIITEDITLAGLTSEIRRVLTGIQINIISGNNQTAKEGTLLPDPIVFTATYKDPGAYEKIPIPKMPLSIKYEDKTLIGKTTTDEDGQAECWVTAISTTPGHGKVIIKPNLTRLPTLYKKYLINAEAIAQYNISEVTPTSFSISIRDEKGNPLPKVEDKIAKSVEKSGHTVSNQAGLLLQGKVSVVDTQEIEGFKGKQFIANSELTLFMVVKSTGEEVSSFSASGKGVSPKSEKKAIEASYNKLTINRKDFVEMLAEAEDAISKAGLYAASTGNPIPVMIKSTPDNAKILINRQDYGYSNTEISLTPGHYEIYLSKPEFEDLIQIIEVNEDQENIFAFALSRISEKEEPIIPTSEHGLKGEYFNLSPWEDKEGPEKVPEFNPTTVQIDSRIAFRWGERIPAPDVTADYFYVRWTGKIHTSVLGTYKFCIGGYKEGLWKGRNKQSWGWRWPGDDDYVGKDTDIGFRLLFDGKIVLDEWVHDFNWEPEKTTGSVFLDGDKWHDIKLEIFEKTGYASCFLLWQPPGLSKFEIIPSSVLRPELK